MNKDKESAITILLVFTILTCATLVILSMYTIRLEKKRNEALIQENEQLLLDLADRENEIYELSVDIKTTNRALAETNAELDRIAGELETTKNADRLLTLEYAGIYNCTAYCTERYSHICGGGGNTASGAPVTANVSVAVTDLKKFPYGTVIYIKDVGIRVVQDTGGFSKDKIDVAVKTHKEASHWSGQGKHEVYIIKWAED